jgi:hypothetical protein
VHAACLAASYSRWAGCFNVANTMAKTWSWLKNGFRIRLGKRRQEGEDDEAAPESSGGRPRGSTVDVRRRTSTNGRTP